MQTIPAKDGFALAATIYQAGSDVVIINAATAVPRQFYNRFATFLNQQGFTVITYDYRGIGESKPATLRGFKAEMNDWGMLDMQGVLDWTVAEFNPTSLFIIGHSSGGQQMGLITDSSRINAMVTLSAQSGYWRLQGGRQPVVVWLLVYLIIPLLTGVFGYFPWSKFGKAEDLPKGVAQEWARWCRDPLYLLGDRDLPTQRFQQFSAPVLAYSIDDDDWGTAKSVQTLMSAYPDVAYTHIMPADYGLKSLGHFGYFRSQSEPIWHETVAWLRQYIMCINKLNG